MDFETQPYLVLVKTNASGYITAVNSSAFVSDVTGWAAVDSGYGDKYHHAQGNYFPLPLHTDAGACRYKLAEGKTLECTPEEMAAQEGALRPKPTAPRNMTAGEYLTVSGTLYRVTHAIPRGERILPGQNAEVTTLEALLTQLMKGE